MIGVARFQNVPAQYNSIADRKSAAKFAIIRDKISDWKGTNRLVNSSHVWDINLKDFLRRTNSNAAQMTRHIRWPQQMLLGCGTISGGRFIFKRHGCCFRKRSSAFDQALVLNMPGAKQQRMLVSCWVARFWVQPIYRA
jgi:hypothetical protein